jgi:hypothetical protein
MHLMTLSIRFRSDRYFIDFDFYMNKLMTNVNVSIRLSDDADRSCFDLYYVLYQLILSVCL